MTLHLAILTSLISRNAGGLFNSVRRLGQSLDSDCAVRTTVFGVADDHSTEDLGAWNPLVPNVYPGMGPRALHFAPGLLPGLTAAKPDLVHVHGLWTYPSLACTRWGRQSGKPHVISPRGMLDPWALKNSSWKKKIAHFLFEGRHLRSASCIHALCESEAQSIRQFGLKTPICIVPNGVDLPNNLVSSAPTKANRIKKVLFLGRIHPKKGLERALDAWRELKRFNTSVPWRFLIAGWDQGQHLDRLKGHCRALGLTFQSVPVSEWPNRTSRVEISQLEQSDQFPGVDNFADADVFFLGPAFGNDKDRLMRTSDAFILPSYSEGLPMAVLEAWAYGLPVLMTPECNLPEGFADRAAIQITHETACDRAGIASSIVDGLCTLVEMEDSERLAMGARGRSLVERRFTWPRIAGEMRDVYNWVVGGGTPPTNVVLYQQ